MAHIIADRVLETTTTTGTGALTLAGAVTGFQAFSAVCATNDTVPYYIEAVDGSGVPTGEWETGFGTYSGTNTLTRTTVYASSNSGSAVNLSAGTKRVGLGQLARDMANLLPHFMYLNADYTLTSTTATQKLFNTTTNGRFTLATGLYEFRGLIYLTAMSSTSGNLNFDILGAGTATVSGVGVAAYGRDGVFLDSSGGSVITGNFQRAAFFSRPVQAGIGVEAWFKLGGVFKLTGAGTLIPSVALDNAAPAVVKQSSYIALRRLGDSTTYASGSAD